MYLLIMANNTVDYIISCAVANSLTDDMKKEIKTLGPHQPDMDIRQQNRLFNKRFYNIESWLCGCPKRNAFFCFVCLVMNSPKSDPCWVKKGVCDLKHLRDKIKRHKGSIIHLNNCLEFTTLGKVNITCQLNSAHRQNVAEHNEKVSKNRHILSRLIDCIKFCGIFDVANDTETSSNPGIFRGLVNLLAEIDGTLKEFINQTNNTLFMGLSETIQNELLDSIYAVARALIQAEIDKTDYIAIMADETTDSTTPSQLVFIVRYELDGQIQERFLGFLFINDHSADGITDAILNELESIGINKCVHKLIAQSYDGAAVMSDKDNGVQAKVKCVYDNAHYIHCYAHQLDLVIERAASQNKRARIFFSNIQGFTTFFATNPKRTAVLDELLKKRITWEFKNRCVITVYAYKEALIKCLEQIIDDPRYDRNTTREAVALNTMLHDSEFNYWLDFFNKVMGNYETMFCQLETPYLNSTNMRRYVSTFKETIQQVVADESADSPVVEQKRPRCQDESDHSTKEVSKSAFEQSIERVVNEAAADSPQERPRCQDENDHVAKEVSDRDYVVKEEDCCQDENDHPTQRMNESEFKQLIQQVMDETDDPAVAQQKTPRFQDENDHLAMESAYEQSIQQVVNESADSPVVEQKRPRFHDENDHLTKKVSDRDCVVKEEKDSLVTQPKRPRSPDENDHDYVVKQEDDLLVTQQKRPRYQDDNSEVVGNSIIDQEYIVKEEDEICEEVGESTVCDESLTKDAVALQKIPRNEDENKRVNVLQEVCESILTSLEDRFRFTDHLSIAALFQPKLFSKYQLLFPDTGLDLAVAIFNLDRYQLRQELAVIYSRPDFTSAYGALTILQCFYDNHLSAAFPESVKLLKIICTMPMTTVECDRTFSTLKRIKTFARNTVCENGLKLNALAMCSVEKKLLFAKNFNELVIDHFAKDKEEFMYKKIN